MSRFVQRQGISGDPIALRPGGIAAMLLGVLILSAAGIGWLVMRGKRRQSRW